MRLPCVVRPLESHDDLQSIGSTYPKMSLHFFGFCLQITSTTSKLINQLTVIMKNKTELQKIICCSLDSMFLFYICHRLRPAGLATCDCSLVPGRPSVTQPMYMDIRKSSVPPILMISIPLILTSSKDHVKMSYPISIEVTACIVFASM